MLKPKELPSELDLAELVVRSSRMAYLGRTLIFGFPVLFCIYYSFFGDTNTLQSYKSGKYAELAFIFAFLVGTLYHLYRIISPATLAILNEKGLRIKKYNLITWDSITGYYSTSNYHEYGSEETFFIQLKDTHEVIKVDLSSANATAKTLKRYIYLFKGESQILNFDEFDD